MFFLFKKNCELGHALFAIKSQIFKKWWIRNVHKGEKERKYMKIGFNTMGFQLFVRGPNVEYYREGKSNILFKN